jgi:hypothetical protein
VDIARAFTYVTEDENWQNKVVITLVVGFVPIINLAAIGWMLDLIRNMIDGQAHPLPDWDDIGNQFVERWVAGLMTAIAVLLYAVPLIVISVCVGITLALVDFGLLRFVMSLIGIAYMAAAWMPMSIGMMRYARTRDFSHYLQFANNINVVQQHMATMIVLAVYVFVVGFVINVLGNLDCIGWIFSLLSVGINAIVIGHLTGQAAQEMTASDQP